MKPTPVGSFVKFLFGFLVFIGISFGVTFAVNSYTLAHQQGESAAAEATMLQ